MLLLLWLQGVYSNKQFYRLLLPQKMCAQNRSSRTFKQQCYKHLLIRMCPYQQFIPGIAVASKRMCTKDIVLYLQTAMLQLHASVAMVTLCP